MPGPRAGPLAIESLYSSSAAAARLWRPHYGSAAAACAASCARAGRPVMARGHATNPKSARSETDPRWVNTLYSLAMERTAHVSRKIAFGAWRRQLELAAAFLISLLVMLISNPSAAAAVSGRLDGAFSVAESVTVSMNVVDQEVGDKYNVTWQFSASCSTGSCPTTLTRHLVSNGQTFTYNLVPAADGTYHGSGNRSSDCLNGNGSLLLANGYTVTDTFSVEPTAINSAGNVTSWSGSLKADGVATQAAINAGCPATQELMTLLGTLAGPSWVTQPPQEVLRPVIGSRNFKIQAKSPNPGPVALSWTSTGNAHCTQAGVVSTGGSN